jgi:hypothetical protein
MGAERRPLYVFVAAAAETAALQNRDARPRFCFPFSNFEGSCKTTGRMPLCQYLLNAVEFNRPLLRLFSSAKIEDEDEKE